MLHNCYYKLTSVLALAIWLVISALPVAAQDEYGVGVEVEVPRVSPGTIVTDGVMDEPIWDVAASFDLLQYANFFTDDVPEPDLAAEGRALYTDDTLYVFVQMLDNELFVNADEVYESDQILIGVDGTHAGDDQVDEGYGGWVDNAPDQGPTTYKVYLDGITLNWGFNDVDPVDEGWTRGTVFRDDDTQEWGVEMAIYVPQIEPGAQIGFNIGGAQANADMGFAYGFFSWQAIEDGTAGGDVMNNAASFATLTMKEPATGGEGYGIGVEVEVPRVSAGTITTDGTMDEPIWDVAASFDLLQYANFFTDDIPEPDLAAEGRALYTDDTLYVFVRMLDNELFVNADEVYESDQILIGVDGTHAGDDQVDDGYGGWVDNAPDQGPTTYKVYLDGITLNWGFNDVDPVDEGWTRGTVFRDDDTQEWGVEMAIYVPQIEPGAQIGFNIGGAQANADMGFAYGFFSWQAIEDGTAGGDVMNNAASFATLTMKEPATGGEGYGIGVTVDVPRVRDNNLVIDGRADEGHWDDAPTFDLLNFANFFTDDIPEPDLAAEGRALYTDDSLYVFVRVLDNELFVNADEVYESDQILIGVDGTHAGDDQVDDGYGGWVDNAPDKGPTTYKVYLDGITLNWGFNDVDPVAEGWARGEVFRDDDTQEWGVEMAIYVPQIEEGANIGFNIGGAQANADMGFAYGFYSWQAIEDGTAGGDVMNNAASFATLHMSSETVAIEDEKLDELPTRFVLEQNYPNPFNPRTTIEFGITRTGAVELNVFDVLGQKVATLVDEQRATGTYRVTWEAENLSSGMYLYQLRVDGDLIGTKTMTLIK